ncbi:MAG: heavy metal-binding domain-containing protein [Flammeovirgaceae bacterium]
MLISTTESIEGKRVVKYLGVVSGEAIIGANAIKDYFAQITDVIGGRSSGYERSLRKAKRLALEDMEEQAEDLGANAIIGVDLDYETIGEKSSMVMVSANGTAVVLE